LPESTPEPRQNGEFTWRNCDTSPHEFREAKAQFPYKNWKNEGNDDRGSAKERENYFKNSLICSNNKENNIEKGKAKNNSIETQPEFNFQTTNRINAAEGSSVAAQSHSATQINPWITNDIVEIIELHTTAWKLGMQISENYGSISPDHPFKYNLTQKYCDPNSLYY